VFTGCKNVVRKRYLKRYCWDRWVGLPVVNSTGQTSETIVPGVRQMDLSPWQTQCALLTVTWTDEINAITVTKGEVSDGQS
jgi:hypothetical protein